MKTSPEGIALMHHFEGCRLIAYPDPATGGDPWTIGWGHTGPEVMRGLVWSQEYADLMFAERLAREFEPGVAALNVGSITQSQFDALVCLSYNIGVRNLTRSTLVRKLQAGDVLGAADQFLVWDKAAGKSMKGLRRRRAAEKMLFLGSPAVDCIRFAETVQ